MPQYFINAHKPVPDCKVQISTDFLQAFPVLTFAKSDSLRRRVWEGITNRTYPKNRDVLLKLLNMRFEVSSLLSYSSWPDYSAASKMTLNGARIIAFLNDLSAAVA